MLPSDFKEQVRAQTDIVALIGESLSLQPRNGGRLYVGLCPFHDDHNPSFNVDPGRQSYRCWVCNEGGDAFSWIQKRESVSFPEALEILARRANIEIPKSSGRSDQATDNKAQLFEVLLWAEGVFHRALLEAPFAEKARQYIRSRGFTKETVDRFRIGYHPNDWEWLQKQARGKFHPKQLEAVKLIGERDGGRGNFDHFVDRVVFPIRNERSQVVGFGGRVLPGADDSHGKYWNSPESSVFYKSRLVYGLDFARDGLKQSGIAVVTEGYTDCIMCHQHGLTNVVGTLGTALTDQHVATLKRFVQKVVLVYDGDEPGQRAAEKAVDRFLAQDVDLRIMTLPDAQDPDEFLSARGADAWRSLAEKAPEAWEYKFQTLRNRYTLDTVNARQQVLDEMLITLSAIPKMAANVREGLYLANLAQRLGASEEQVRQRYRDVRDRTKRAVRIDTPAPVQDETYRRLLSSQLTRDDKLECELLEMVFASPQWASIVQNEIPVELIRHSYLRRLLSQTYELLNTGGTLTRESLLAAIEDDVLKRLAVWLDDRAQAKGLCDKLNDTVRRGGPPFSGSSGNAGRPAESTSNVEDDSHIGCPLLLRQLLENLQRREEQSDKRIAMQLSEQGDGSRELDEATTRLLRQAAEIHQRRATKRAPA